MPRQGDADTSPLFTVIIPSKNRARFLHHTLSGETGRRLRLGIVGRRQKAPADRCDDSSSSFLIVTIEREYSIGKFVRT